MSIETRISLDDLPLPPPEALEASRDLLARIREEVEAAGGRIPFSRYMERALYEPGLGYYSGGSRNFGDAGDFVTAPETSPVFSACLARQCAEILTASGGREILELGAGSGVMAADILRELARIDALPERYAILEISSELRDRQRETIRARAPELFDRVVWLDTLPDAVEGVILGNEVLDALPVERFRIEGGRIRRLEVVADADGLSLVTGDAPESLVRAVDHIGDDIGRTLEEGYESEVCLRLGPFIASLADCLRRGVLLFLDYGYSRREYYHPDRRRGTLMCHYRHHAHEAVFLHPGLQDITAWVDFTALAEAAVAHDLELAGYTTQANFLLGSGLDQVMTRMEPDTERERIELAAQVRRLTLPGEMGERFKAVALERDGPYDLSGFAFRDLSAVL